MTVLRYVLLNRLLPFRLVLALSVPVVLLGIGTTGYQMIEGWPWFDALYMTVITLTTVGYGETHPLSPQGQAFTMVLLLFGVFSLFYFATEFIRAAVSGEIRGTVEKHLMERQLAELRNHLIVCGFGRMGRLVCLEFAQEKIPFVVIERSSELLQDFNIPLGIPLEGDATVDDVLRKAGIDRARALVTVVASNADNLYITMSARLLNDQIFIVARAVEQESEQKLLRAGANRVVSPYVIGGSRVAQAVLRPNVVDFIELATRTAHVELQIEEMTLVAGCPLQGANLRDSRLRQNLGIIILAIKRASAEMIFNPPPDTILTVGDTLIAIGDRARLKDLEHLAEAPESES